MVPQQKYIWLLFSGFLLLCPAFIFAQKEADAVVGVWYNGSKESKIEIYKCDSRYCGKIIWLKEPLAENGKPKIDKNNPDEKLRTRLILGMNLMRGFTYDEDNVWVDGEIYDPKSGKTYSCKMTLTDKNNLDVRGFVGISIIGRTDFWTRAE
ncbi:DUF2147 domain-containing protein [Rhodocytophaga rosea]|uniref:DUF2147 domain-containing protein n=1 Tax=Rhodocytophaga rosea TaxID=2704465 RepID=A0A6C0GRL0_9BACT|nr:DUF2147 domain-containing protein [Rhodocytophaga rosea]QHT70182.1 DUF2147 domain-containing protein [Rhodocytophaga rosea]